MSVTRDSEIYLKRELEIEPDISMTMAHSILGWCWCEAAAAAAPGLTSPAG